jgi:peptidase M48-like protein
VLLNYPLLVVLVCISVFTLICTAVSCLLASMHPWIRRAFAHRPARERARRWMTIRFLPTAAGLASTVGFGLAFARHEPRDTFEQAGVVLLLLAATAAVLVSTAAWRVVRSLWRTARCHRLVRLLGERIDVPGFPLPTWRVPVDFPVAAVSGIVKPRLILSSRILDECPRDELAAVLRHEAAHASRHDNLVRMSLLACPDAVGIGGHAVLAEWHRAVEEAADEEATRSDSSARLALAAALVRVSRMSAVSRPSWMPALALYDGSTLEGRVRRLLQPDANRNDASGSRVLKIAGALMIAAAVWVATGPRLLHALIEWGIRNLP